MAKKEKAQSAAATAVATTTLSPAQRHNQFPPPKSSDPHNHQSTQQTASTSTALPAALATAKCGARQPSSSFQSYCRLKRDCLRRKQLFVDIEFPPTNSSLFLDVNRSSDIVWKRPGEIVDNPKLFVEGASPNDVTQGILGNCWFVSACSALTHNEDLLMQVIPNAVDQEWGAETATGNKHNAYAGIFLFQFWRFGRWMEVIIDDLLPTKDGKLLFARSKTPNEFWSALLEKAFAKLYGCYENLVGGQLADALQDVSGGVAETINVQKFLAGNFGGDPTDGATRMANNNNSHSGASNNTNSNSKAAVTADAMARLFRMLRAAFDQQALIVAAIAAKNKEDVEKSLSCGLVKGHAYAVTAVRYIELDAVKEHHRSSAKRFFTTVERKMMIRLQNPWGEKEWNGPWSDGSAEWEQVTNSQKHELGITVDEDGEFWMPWDQFVKYFTDISVCKLFNTLASANCSGNGNGGGGGQSFLLNGQKISSSRRRRMLSLISSPKSVSMAPSASTIRARAPNYNEYVFYDSWTTNGVKSGAPLDRTGGCQNFAATFCFNPQYCFDVRDVNSGEVVIALTQKEITEQGRQREPFVTIGIHVMKVECNRKHRIHQAINPIGTSDYASSRSVYLHLNDLSVGRYVVMPTTYAPREQADFMLRFYSRGPIKPVVLTVDAPRPSLLQCSTVRSVTRIKVTEATISVVNDVNVYCYVISGGVFGERARTPVIRASSGRARFNEMFIFHKNSLKQTYRFEVWQDARSMRGDKRLATCALTVQTDNDTVSYTVDMCSGASGDSSKTIVGKIVLEVSSYDDPMYL